MWQPGRTWSAMILVTGLSLGLIGCGGGGSGGATGAAGTTVAPRPATSVPPVASSVVPVSGCDAMAYRKTDASSPQVSRNGDGTVRAAWFGLVTVGGNERVCWDVQFDIRPAAGWEMNEKITVGVWSLPGSGLAGPREGDPSRPPTIDTIAAPYLDGETWDELVHRAFAFGESQRRDGVDASGLRWFEDVGQPSAVTYVMLREVDSQMYILCALSLDNMERQPQNEVAAAVEAARSMCLSIDNVEVMGMVTYPLG